MCSSATPYLEVQMPETGHARREGVVHAAPGLHAGVIKGHAEGGGLQAVRQVAQHFLAQAEGIRYVQQLQARAHREQPNQACSVSQDAFRWQAQKVFSSLSL